MIQFDEYFSDGLVQPPTSYVLRDPSIKNTLAMLSKVTFFGMVS